MNLDINHMKKKKIMKKEKRKKEKGLFQKTKEV